MRQIGGGNIQLSIPPTQKKKKEKKEDYKKILNLFTKWNRIVLIPYDSIKEQERPFGFVLLHTYLLRLP